MGKLIPIPSPNESKEDYIKRLEEFKKNYWNFLKPDFLKKKKK